MANILLSLSLSLSFSLLFVVCHIQDGILNALARIYYLHLS